MADIHLARSTNIQRLFNFIYKHRVFVNKLLVLIEHIKRGISIKIWNAIFL